jgi:hypothetical protein
MFIDISKYARPRKRFLGRGSMSSQNPKAAVFAGFAEVAKASNRQRSNWTQF